jgi:arylsulfatase A-like enzyme
MFEGGTRLPFIIRYPEIIKPGKSNALISQVDLLASFAGMNKIELNKEDAMDSENQLDALLGKKVKGRSICIEQNNDGVLAIIKDGWKYIQPADGPALLEGVNIESGLDKEPQLYNLMEDESEKNNIASKYPEQIRELSKELEKIVSQRTNEKRSN